MISAGPSGPSLGCQMPTNIDYCRQGPTTKTVAAQRFHRDDQEATDESACTPGSVPRRVARWRPSISACRCRQALAAYPQARAGSPRTPAQAPPRGRPYGLAPGGVYRATLVTQGAGGLLPHRFTLTRSVHGRPGGLFSVALSRGSPRVAVNNHPALWSPDVPRRHPGGVPTRPPGRLVRRACHATSGWISTTYCCSWPPVSPPVR